jgi:hypothetical protein
MGKGEWGGGDEGWGWEGRCHSTKIHQCHPVERFFSEPRIFFVDDDRGLSAIGQSDSELNFYDDMDQKPLFRHFSFR